ncbi:MAG: PilZ domain-containing protein [Desulfobacteraceae bacterium]
MSRKDLPERRKHKRIQVKKPVFVEFAAEPSKVGQIIDISRGGISFRYIAEEEVLNESFEVRIYSAVDSVSLDKVPVKTVYDFKIGPGFTISATQARRRGAKFAEMTRKQISQLKSFIQSLTEAKA